MVQQHKQAAKEKPQPKEKKADAPQQEQLQLPADPAEWAVWEKSVSDAIASADTIEALQALHAEHADVQKEAPADLRDGIAQQFTDRAAEIAAGPDDGAAAGDTGNETAAGDD